MDSYLNKARLEPAEAAGVFDLARTARALVALTKPKIAFASLITTLAAYMAAKGPADAISIFSLAGGTAAAAAGSLAFNQWWERNSDGYMQRTRSRPLPRAELSATTALVWSLALSVFGTAWLALAFNFTAAGLAAGTIVIYGLLYTPMKFCTRWATEVGSVSGAMPPLLGAVVAGDPWSVPAWILAAVLLFWQMPHFFSIGWIHRRDYRAAGLPLLPAIDETGRRTAAWSVIYSFSLLGALITPWFLGWTGAIYGVPSMISGVWIFWRSWQFQRAKGDRKIEARRLFRSTIFTLPIVLFALVADHL